QHLAGVTLRDPDGRLRPSHREEQPGQSGDEQDGGNMAAENGAFAHHLVEKGEVRKADGVSTAPLLARQVEADKHRDAQQPEQEPRRLEAHTVTRAGGRPRWASRCLMKRTSCGTSSATVFSSAIAARDRRRSERIASRCSSAALSKRKRRRASPVSTRIC